MIIALFIFRILQETTVGALYRQAGANASLKFTLRPWLNPLGIILTNKIGTLLVLRGQIPPNDQINVCKANSEFLVVTKVVTFRFGMVVIDWNQFSICRQEDFQDY